MKMCVVSLAYADTDKLQNLNGSTFKTRADAVNAVKQCAYVDVHDGHAEYESELERAQNELALSFSWFESMAELAEELNEIDADNLVMNSVFVALDWETDK